MGALSSFGFEKFLATGRFQNGPPTAQNLGHGADVQTLEVSINESLIALKHAHDFQLVEDCGTHHRADGRIHSGGVPS